MQARLPHDSERSQSAPSIHEPDPPPAAEDAQPLWSVVEIEGEAVRVVEESVGLLTAPAAASVYAPIVDDQDDVLVAALDARRCSVAAGESAHLRVALLNNGDRRACFQIHVEGWVDESWVRFSRGEDDGGQPRLQLWLEPGERCMATAVITPPRVAASGAGDRPLAVVVRAPQYAGRFCRLGAILTIQPYTNLILGRAQPSRLMTSRSQRTTFLQLPVTNGGNSKVALFVQVQDAQHCCQIALRLPEGTAVQRGRAAFTLAPGEATTIIARITPPPPPLIGLRKRRIQVRAAVGFVKAQQTPLAASAVVTTAPLVGPWFVGLALALMICGALSALVVSAIAVTLAKRDATPPALVEPVGESDQQAAAAPQPITIIVNLAQPAPTQQQAAPITLRGESGLDAAAAPIVRADQVTTPGQPSGPAFRPGQSNAPPPAAQETLTYQQMFQEIALRYDLNWRALAAQAYIESGFDTLALGNSGDMGLMQILPATWRDWAPVVAANDPFDAYSNVTVAAAYLDHLRSELSAKGHPQIEWMLVAYNWGIEKVNGHLQAGLGWDDLPAPRRQYALDILRIAETIPAN